ncbi:MAG: metal-dependent hydrolase family protein [Chloroflexota bacterium]
MTGLAIKGAKLIDGTGAEPLDDSLVMVADGRIAWQGRRVDAPRELAGWDVVEAAGCSLVPGLIDCHVHITADPDPRFLPAVALADSAATAALRAARNARQTVEAGVTCVRDMGSTKPGVAIDLGRAIAQGFVVGPRIVAAGTSICMTGGHGWFIGREADGPQEVRKAAREQLKAGAELVKLMATGGVLTPGLDVGGTGLSLEEMAAAVGEAHNAGKHTAAHAIGTQGIKNALNAGVDSIEHGCMLDEECLALLVRREAYYVPTLSAVTHIVRHAEQGEMADYVGRKARQVYDFHLQSFAAARQAGVRIAAGTDASTPYNPHGGLPYELELMVAAGASPVEALRSATVVAAELLGLAREIGTVAIGKQADLLLVAGDPLADIRVLQMPRLVVKGGAVVARRQV